MVKQRPRDAKWVTKDHSAGSWQRQTSPESYPIVTRPHISCFAELMEVTYFEPGKKYPYKSYCDLRRSFLPPFPSSLLPECPVDLSEEGTCRSVCTILTKKTFWERDPPVSKTRRMPCDVVGRFQKQMHTCWQEFLFSTSIMGQREKKYHKELLNQIANNLQPIRVTDSFRKLFAKKSFW